MVDMAVKNIVLILILLVRLIGEIEETGHIGDQLDIKTETLFTSCKVKLFKILDKNL